MNIYIGRKHILAVVALLATLGFGLTAQAELITTDEGIPSPVVIDFSEFSGGWLSGAGPVQIGNPVSRDIEWFTDNSGSVIGDGGYGLTTNGQWTAARNGFTGLNASAGSMTYRFNDSPVAVVGGFMNYAPGNGIPSIEALDEFGVVLETYDLLAVAPIVTPDATDDGAFRGINRPTADIYALRITNGFDVLDDLTFSGSPVQAVDPVSIPTLSTWALLLLAGLLTLVAFNRRRVNF